jgi:hypothetical protein
VRGVAREAMRLGRQEAEAFTRIADVKGFRDSRFQAGRHVEGPELVVRRLLLNVARRRAIPPCSMCSASQASAAPT